MDNTKNEKLIDISIEIRTDLKGHTYVNNNELTLHYEFDSPVDSDAGKATYFKKYTFGSDKSEEIKVQNMIEYFNDCIKKQVAPTELGYKTFVKEEIEKIRDILVKKVEDLRHQ